jgi:hypothetical protein
MSGAVHLLHLYAFMAWAETTLHKIPLGLVIHYSANYWVGVLRYYLIYCFWKYQKQDIDKCSGYMIKNEWSFTCTPPICLHGMGKENFT